MRLGARIERSGLLDCGITTRVGQITGLNRAMPAFRAPNEGPRRVPVTALSKSAKLFRDWLRNAQVGKEIPKLLVRKPIQQSIRHQAAACGLQFHDLFL